MDAEGKVQFLSDINNVERTAHEHLYRDLEQLLEIALPQMEVAILDGPTSRMPPLLNNRRLQVPKIS